MATSYIICAAGSGKRTSDINPHVPKPLLSLNGKLLIEYSLDSLPIAQEDQVIIIGLANDQLNRCEVQLKKYCANIQWVEIEEVTRGQLETAMKGIEFVDSDNSIAIYNCDTFFECANLKKIEELDFVEGVIPCSKEYGNAWSFCRTEDSDKQFLKVVEVAEKNRISDWCSAGYYFFKSKNRFIQFATEELSSQRHAEYYVAPIYNSYIKDQNLIVVVPCQVFRAMGSVEQLKDYWGLSLEDMIQQNQNNPYKRS